MAKKDTDVLKQIRSMLADLKDKDKDQYDILLSILQEVYLEYNSGQKRNIERKLYEVIDGKANYKLKE